MLKSKDVTLIKFHATKSFCKKDFHANTDMLSISDECKF